MRDANVRACQPVPVSRELKLETHLDMNKLFALSASVIRRLSTADRMITPKTIQISKSFLVCYVRRNTPMARKYDSSCPSSCCFPVRRATLTRGNFTGKRPLTYRLPCSNELYAQSKANGRLSMLKIGTPTNKLYTTIHLTKKIYSHSA